jgi:hypothetical protein
VTSPVSPGRSGAVLGFQYSDPTPWVPSCPSAASQAAPSQEAPFPTGQAIVPAGGEKGLDTLRGWASSCSDAHSVRPRPSVPRAHGIQDLCEVSVTKL